MAGTHLPAGATLRRACSATSVPRSFHADTPSQFTPWKDGSGYVWEGLGFPVEVSAEPVHSPTSVADAQPASKQQSCQPEDVFRAASSGVRPFFLAPAHGLLTQATSRCPRARQAGQPRPFWKPEPRTKPRCAQAQRFHGKPLTSRQAKEARDHFLKFDREEALAQLDYPWKTTSLASAQPLTVRKQSVVWAQLASPSFSSLPLPSHQQDAQEKYIARVLVEAAARRAAASASGGAGASAASSVPPLLPLDGTRTFPPPHMVQLFQGQPRLHIRNEVCFFSLHPSLLHCLV